MGIGALYSDQETNRRSVPVVLAGPNERGKLRAAYFSVTVAGADLDATTTIDLCSIPAGARVQGGVVYNNAAFGAAGCTFSIGHAGADPDLWAGAITADAETFTVIPNVPAAVSNGLVPLTSNVVARITTAVAALLVGGTCKGFIFYVLD